MGLQQPICFCATQLVISMTEVKLRTRNAFSAYVKSIPNNTKADNEQEIVEKVLSSYRKPWVA